MNKRPLKELLVAMHQGKFEFPELDTGDITSLYETKKYNDREVHVPNKKLRTFHSFIKLILLDHLDTNEDVVFSYRKGVNAVDAVSKHSRSKYFFQTDIKNFFNSIDEDMVKETILKNIEQCPISDIQDHIEKIVKTLTVNNSVPVGFSTSPTLSNACLFTFDNTLQEYCKNNSLVFSRYSDDIIISSMEKSSTFEAEKYISQKLSEITKNKLSINEAKSKHTQTGNKIKLLGMVILPNGKVSIDIKFKQDTEIKLHYYLTNKETFKKIVGSDFDGAIEKISGHLNYYNTVDPSYLDKLRKKYGTTTVDMFLHKSDKL
ncbi:reverse transcriptase domain-containing protein [Pseudomonas moraviensis]|uniref:RNA-directed DNA polymerase n=1 Tax=Pseudomonas moraviensis TaxID=321662 RepID=A0A7Y9W1N6_9PSED|nr:reverse transcriptase domain-containing protein [Pseudomonas moraviensis]NYH12672.1 RNA-directed DNA polymerase [Pseudomonas moraviensis]